MEASTRLTGISTAALANPYNAYVNYRPADYDARHVINANYVWQLSIRRLLQGHGWAPLVEAAQSLGRSILPKWLPYTIIDGQQETNPSGNNFFGPYWPTPNNAVAISCGGEIHAGPNAVPCYSVSTSNWLTGLRPVQSQCPVISRSLVAERPSARRDSATTTVARTIGTRTSAS